MCQSPFHVLWNDSWRSMRPRSLGCTLSRWATPGLHITILSSSVFSIYVLMAWNIFLLSLLIPTYASGPHSRVPSSGSLLWIFQSQVNCKVLPEHLMLFSVPALTVLDDTSPLTCFLHRTGARQRLGCFTLWPKITQGHKLIGTCWRWEEMTCPGWQMGVGVPQDEISMTSVGLRHVLPGGGKWALQGDLESQWTAKDGNKNIPGKHPTSCFLKKCRDGAWWDLTFIHPIMGDHSLDQRMGKRQRPCCVF